MKEFRGTLIALLVFLGLGAFFFLREEKGNQDETEKQIFSFEKHEVSSATIYRPDGEIIKLIEKDGKWWIEGTDWQANLTMVNRIRHQLHNLEARAKVTREKDDLDLYGLGKKAIRVELMLNSGKKIEFLAGDPNPTGVSYYIRPLPGDTVYTVKKSALDYYSAPFDEFRNQHFVTMDTKSVQSFQMWNTQGEFHFERIDEYRWKLREPEMRVSKDSMRTMIGRAIALKATRFVDLVEQNQDYGLSNPVLQLQFNLEDGTNIHIRVGSEAKEKGFAYFQVGDDPVIYVAKNGLLEEFDVSPEELRNREVLDVLETEVRSLSIKDIEEGKEVRISLEGDAWLWSNGQPISGSTPDRVLTSLSSLKAMEFSTAENLGQVVGEVRLITKEEEERVLLIGSAAPNKKVGKDQEIPQRYAQAIRIHNDREEQETLIMDEYAWSVLQDLIQEWEKTQK